MPMSVYSACKALLLSKGSALYVAMAAIYKTQIATRVSKDVENALALKPVIPASQVIS